MQIECVTTSAASQVVFILMAARLQPGVEFHVDGPYIPDPPVQFRLSAPPSSDIVRQLQGIADISIEGAAVG